jgi:hypothetical protein
LEENLVTKTKNAENLALFMTRAENVFDSTLKATKYGKYLVNPIKTGLEFEATGRIFGSTQDEMYFLSGFTGGIASEAFAGLVSKMPANKVYGYMKSMFGGQTDKAVNVIKKIGELNTRGLVETAEEFGNELSNIYTDELRTKGFFDEVKAQFGDLDRVQEFVISTFIMGAAFGIVDSDKKRAAYESLSPEKKAQVDEVLNAVREDMQSAEDNVDKYVDEQTEEIDRKQKFEKEPQKEVKTNDLGEIEFDAENIKEASEGRPSVVAEAKEEPASFTEPIDLTKLEENAEKDQAGIPSEERVGEEPIETKPVAEAGKEEVSPSGVVQEEQKVTEEKPVSKSKRKRTAAKETATKVVGEEIVKETKAEVAPKAEEFFGYSKENPKIIENENDAIELDRITRDSFEEKISGLYLDRKGKNWVVSLPSSGDVRFKGSLKKAKEYLKNYNLEREAVGFKESATEPTTPTKTETTAKAEPSGKTRELPTAETANQFKEASSISKMPMRSPKRKKAVADFDAKYGEGSYKRVSKIDANFGDIINKLENSNIVTKEC